MRFIDKFFYNNIINTYLENYTGSRMQINALLMLVYSNNLAGKRK